MRRCLACEGTGTLRTIRPGYQCRFCKGTGRTDIIPNSIFRVVGGYSNRKTLNKYEIIPYTLIHESPKYWYTVKDGKYEIQNKRITANSAFYSKIYEALLKLQSRINLAADSIQNTLDKVVDNAPSNSTMKRIYVVTFKEEQFHLYYYTIISETRKGTKVDEVTFMGKRYVYPHTSKPHNPDEPVERWIGKDFFVIKMMMQLYAENRLNYLHSAKMKCEDWVRLYEKETKLRNAKN